MTTSAYTPSSANFHHEHGRYRRRFATEGAAWRVLVPGATPVLFRQRRAAMVRAGWRVMLDTPAAIG